MKKIIGILLCILIVFSMMTSTLAAEISLLDVDNDLMTLSGNARPGENISILVVNPGFSKEDATNGKEGAIQYFGTYVPKNNEYAFDFQITGEVGGEFKAYVLTKAGEEEIKFTFYNSLFKKKCIKAINNAGKDEDVTGLYESLVEAFGFEEDVLYKEISSKSGMEAFLLIRDELDGKEIPENMSEVSLLLKQSFLLAAFNSSREDIIFPDGVFAFAEEIEVSGSEEYKDYNESLSDKGVRKVNDALISGKYSSISEITDTFKDAVYLNVIMNYKKSGYGHIQTYFEKYEEAYEDAGISVPKKENRSLYLKLLDCGAKTLKELAEKFDKLSKTKTESSSTGGGGISSSRPGTGASSSMTSGAVAYVPVETPAQNTAVSFTDIDDKHWGYKAVNALSEKGYLKGYEDGSFKPSGNITRAEFTKILALAFKLEGDSSVAFEDVSSDAWYAPYVSGALKAGIVKGDGTLFNPSALLTREDAAVMICRALGKESENDIDFADSSEISDYAKKAVGFLKEAGIINGYEDNTFRAKNNITRAEIAQIIFTMEEKEAEVK